MVNKGYQVVHSHRFDKELEQLTGTLKLGDELTKGVLLIVARNPYIGVQCGENIWCFNLANEELGRVFIYYTIKKTPKKEVCLLSIKKF